MTRKKIAANTYANLAANFTRKNYVVNKEISFNVGKRKRIRADLVALNMKQEVIIVEIKSCLQDFLADNKYTQYKQFCHKLYIGTDLETAEKIKPLVDKDVGIIVGRTVYKSARRRQIKHEDFMQVLLRFAFRNADFNRIKRHSRET